MAMSPEALWRPGDPADGAVAPVADPVAGQDADGDGSTPPHQLEAYATRGRQSSSSLCLARHHDNDTIPRQKADDAEDALAMDDALACRDGVASQLDPLVGLPGAPRLGDGRRRHDAPPFQVALTGDVWLFGSPE
jgi:hypothetical protein